MPLERLVVPTVNRNAHQRTIKQRPHRAVRHDHQITQGVIAGKIPHRCLDPCLRVNRPFPTTETFARVGKEPVSCFFEIGRA